MTKTRKVAKRSWWQGFLKQRRMADVKRRIVKEENQPPTPEELVRPKRATPSATAGRGAGRGVGKRDDGVRQKHGRDARPPEHRDKQEYGGGTPRLVVGPSRAGAGLLAPVWVYDNMILSTGGRPVDGGTVLLENRQGKFLGSAIYNSQSRIRARLFSLGNAVFDDDYVEHAIVEAWRRRRNHFNINESFRAVYSEADGLPGLIVDKLGDILVVQFLTRAIEMRREVVANVLHALYAPAGTVFRDDAPIRAKEGLTVGEPIANGTVPSPLRVQIDGATHICDPVGGQKTGLFLDQRFNRRLIRPFAKGKRVLDLFCHVGGWSFVAAGSGASEVLGVDSSRQAIDFARLGAEENGFGMARFECSEVFDFLGPMIDRGEKFDVVVCDPPAFAKSHKHLEEAERAYLSLNYRGMKLLEPGGVLATCSCSQHFTEESLNRVLETAARNAHMRFLQIARGTQPPDHPVLLGFSESEYLKCLVLQRVE